MDWKEKVFEGFRLYAVTDLKTESPDVLKRIEAAYRGGADIVQLRSKVLADGALIRLGLKIKKIAEKNRKLFFINDRMDLALATGADGVHLGQEDMPVWVARKLAKQAGLNVWVGKSTHSLNQALAAVSEGVDYIGVGPVFATPSKAAFGAPQGIDRLREATAAARVPVLAIGGVTVAEVPAVRAAGAAGVAVIRAVLAAGDPGAATRALLAAVG